MSRRSAGPKLLLSSRREQTPITNPIRISIRTSLIFCISFFLTAVFAGSLILAGIPVGNKRSAKSGQGVVVVRNWRPYAWQVDVDLQMLSIDRTNLPSTWLPVRCAFRTMWTYVLAQMLNGARRCCLARKPCSSSVVKGCASIVTVTPINFSGKPLSSKVHATGAFWTLPPSLLPQLSGSAPPSNHGK